MNKDFEHPVDHKEQDGDNPTLVQPDEYQKFRQRKLAKNQKGLMLFMQIYTILVVLPVVLYLVPGGIIILKFGHPIVTPIQLILFLANIILGLIFVSLHRFAGMSLGYGVLA